MEIEYKDNYAVVYLSDKLAVFNRNIEIFEHIMQDLYYKGYKRVVLDFTDLRRIDTRGLSSLLIYQKKFKDRGGEIVISNLKNKNIREKFRLIELRRVITIFEEEAV